MNNFKTGFFLLLILLSKQSLSQNTYDKLGMQALVKGDYRSAVAQLEKADSKEPNNINVLKMLGYSYFQCGSYERAIATYSRFINLKPTDYSTYYYRGKARLNMANDPKASSSHLREDYYLSAIKDFTTAIEMSGEEDSQLLQNRGLAYKDYAIYQSYQIKKRSDKINCITLFNNAITDFNSILALHPERKDILSLVEYVKAQIQSLR